MREGLRKLNAALEAHSEGPYFLGDRFSMVRHRRVLPRLPPPLPLPPLTASCRPTCRQADLAAAPFLHRFRATLPHYRGFDPLGDPALERLRTWLAMCEARESLKSTTLPPEQLIEKYVSYAGDRGPSKLGQ